MATKIGILTNFRSFSPMCRSISTGKVIFNQPGAPGGTTNQSPLKNSPSVTANVPGLSPAVLQYGKEPLGPGAAKDTDYKNPEYFSYHQLSYFEAEIEMLKYRCPQPSSKK